MSKNLTCPFCGGVIHTVPYDGEGNYADPWSVPRYLIYHDENDAGGECPIARFSSGGVTIYGSPEEAVKMWNKSWS